MAEITGLQLKVEDHSEDVLKNLAVNIPKAMYAAGLTAQQGIVDFMSQIDATGRDIVDTGRLRASISFITQDEQSGGVRKMITNASTGKRKVVNPLGSDILTGVASKNEVIIGSNVEYASYVNSGTKNKDKSQRTSPRRFMENGIFNNSNKIQQVVTDVLKGVK